MIDRFPDPVVVDIPSFTVTNAVVGIDGIQLAVEAVFRSWKGKRAVDYRREFNITPDMANGTAVNVQAMVFGNMGMESGTGVAMSRNATTGEPGLEGDFVRTWR